MTNNMGSKSASIQATSSILPKRPLQKKQNKLGPYNLLQTLGEGEFGKVKLGIHTETGQEVAIKLIKKEGAGSDSRINKVEREISVLKTLSHPYIVKLYNVVETEKYIGIILEYASGGELFEYILAHRHLKEKDAKRFFAQLISSVQYMHRRKIVHRDLKLENILLDKNRNIIVTDFGFANQFSSAADDLMATTCGSPCYAAPELVVNAGLYAGSAVDIWSCGVILYAMLCGFLPFDDDPSNPDSDNINQLYRYILSTNLMFPVHVSPEARSLLEKMLVPDPTKRCSIDYVVKHPWLESHRSFLKKDAAQIEMEASAASRLSVMPEAKKKSNLIINSTMSNALPRNVTASGVSASTTRKTHIPIASRDRFSPVENVKYLVNNPKPRNIITERSTTPNTDTSANTSSFKQFSIGRSPATTTTVEKPIHAINVASSSRTPNASNFITRKPAKHEDETDYTNNDSAIAVASKPVTANAKGNVENINPERSLSSPTSTANSNPLGLSSFGSIRRGQRRGADKFLSFFTGGRSSHTPSVTKKEEGMTGIFNEGKQKNDAIYVHSEVNINTEYTNKIIETSPNNPVQGSAIRCDNDINEAEEKIPINHNSDHRGITHSSSEISTIGASTPSLCPSTPMNSVEDPSTPLSPTFSPSQYQPNLKTGLNVASIHSTMNSQEESSRQNFLHRETTMDICNNTSVNQEHQESEVYDTTLTQKQQHSPTRNRGNSISATSILSEHQESVNSNSVVSFKDAPRRASPLNVRQRNDNQHLQNDNDSSIRSASINDHQDNASISSHEGPPQPEVSSSTLMMTKSLVSSAVGDGGRHVIAAVRRSIYRKHKSLPPPQKQSKTSNATTSTTKIKEPIMSFAKSRFEETEAPQQKRDRNTMVSSTHVIPGAQLSIEKKKVDIFSTTNNLATAAVPKKTGNKMMDWIKKKSHAKETKKETNAAIIPKTTTPKLNPSAQILTRSKKLNSKKKETAAVVVAAPIEKPTTNTPVVPSKSKVPATNKNRKNDTTLPPQTHAIKIAAKQNTTNKAELATTSHADPVSPIEVPEKSSITTRNKRATSGNEAILAELGKKEGKSSDDTHIQVHQGAIDRTALTSQSPALVIKDIMRILRILGIDTKMESTFVLRCCRRKAKSFVAAQLLKRKQRNLKPYENDDEDYTGEDDDQEIEEPEEDEPIDQSSADSSSIFVSPTSSNAAKGLEPIYGDASIDNGDEIRFAVEICRFKNLPGLYIVDIRRLRGNAWAYKFLYHKLIDLLDLEKNSYLKTPN